MRNRTLTTLTALAGVLAVGSFVSAVIIAVESYRDSFPLGAAVCGVLFLIGVGLLRTQRVTAGTILVGALCLFEVLGFAGWQRHGALDWAFQTSYAVVSLAGLIAAIGAFVSRRRDVSAISA